MDHSGKSTGKFLLPLRRVVIERVEPEIDNGKFPVKRTLGESLVVRADVFADGHDLLDAELLYRLAREQNWQALPMRSLGQDRLEAKFRLSKLEPYVYTLRGWVDPFKTWSAGLQKKVDAGLDVSMELLMGAELIAAAAKRANGPDSKKLQEYAATLKQLSKTHQQEALELSQNHDLTLLLRAHRDTSLDTTYDKELFVEVDREKARFSSWYEMFPRSCVTKEAQHGTLRDCMERLEYVAAMGFDVLYLPPIHPIGRTERKGRNNLASAVEGDTGSPWAIGASEGGHKAIHPQLGNLDDLKKLKEKAEKLGIELALDVAFQCSPDHPYVKEHREWFRTRPDGTVQFAENPPKKYQDIYPLDFESKDVTGLAEELKSIVIYWIKQGIRIFRVDNPHTKPFLFWDWLIQGVKRKYPDVIFLSEAFTVSRAMYRLSKGGFTQSYTYFAWKNTKQELTEYFTELTQPSVAEFFHANLWPNTPDILNAFLQQGGRPAFMSRLILAATLGANYGIYGPAFELGENRPVREGSEEYLNSEKYQIRVWNLDDPASLKPLITKVNQIRRVSPSLQSDRSLRFHPTDNDELIAYSKVSEDRADKILVVVNLDPVHPRAGWVNVLLEEFQLREADSYEVEDLLSETRYTWRGARNYVELKPFVLPAHIFRVRSLK